MLTHCNFCPLGLTYQEPCLIGSDQRFFHDYSKGAPSSAIKSETQRLGK